MLDSPLLWEDNEIRVVVLRPHPWIYRNPFNHLDAMGRKTTFSGDYNIGEYYPDRRDTNLRLDGDLGANCHGLSDYTFANFRQELQRAF